MIKKIATLFIIGAAGWMFNASAGHAGYWDNRFFPSMYPRPINRTLDESRSYFTAETFLMNANGAYGDQAHEKQGIPEIYGIFDLMQMSAAEVTVRGGVSTLRPSWKTINTTMTLNTLGKIQAVGAGIRFEGAVTRHLSLGGAVDVMHVNSNQRFVLPADIARRFNITSQPDRDEIDADRRLILSSLGFKGTGYSGSGFSDTVLYLRVGGGKDYVMKFRQASIGLTIGALVPTGKLRVADNTASVPFGGDGHAGYLIGLDTQLELKEDMWFGFMTYVSDRFDKIENRRLPVAGEPQMFGATSGNVSVSPGMSAYFSPSLRMNDVQKGFGFELQYVYGFHKGDVWADKRNDTTIPINFVDIYDLTKFTTDYVFLNLFYELSRVVPSIRANPVLAVLADFPVGFMGPERIAKTYRLAVSINISF